MTLLVAPCDNQAAAYACRVWHYSRSIPNGKLMMYGAWEFGDFIGAVVFGRGANHNLAASFDLPQTECVELVRIALAAHQAPVSQIGSQAVKLLREGAPGLRLVVSYADPHEGHHGGIYQAMNWIYLGTSARVFRMRIHGELLHKKTVYMRWGNRPLSWIRETIDPEAELVEVPAKHKYVLPLDRAQRRKLLPSALPYPSAVEGSNGEPAGFQPEGAGSIPADRS